MSERQMVKIIKEICSENEIDLKSFSYDWILKLSANNRKMFIIGYKFPNNNASIEQICDDKAALSDILSEQGIPHIEHHYFSVPNAKHQYMAASGDWKRMSNLLDRYGRVVCKANTGSGGRNIYKVDSQCALEAAVYSAFSHGNSICIAPYRNIVAEYRTIIVNSDVVLIYEKKRPTIIGNGIDTVKKLVDQQSDGYNIKIDLDLDLSYIPAENEEIPITWKHNLGQGAKPCIVTDSILMEKLTALALSCTLALDIEFASVDIVSDECGLEVLEINSGVMMENFSSESDDNYAIAKEIYRKAIFSYLKMDDIKYKNLNKKNKRQIVLPLLEEIATEKGIDIIPDEEEGNFTIFAFKNGRRFIAKDYPFNINNAGSISLCSNKSACSWFLKTMGFNVPKEKYFVKNVDINVTLCEIEKYFERPMETLGFSYPMIIKPNDLSQGIGVYRIDTMEEGMYAAQKVMNLKDKLFILQEYCMGHDYRIVVLNGEIIQAYERIPFQIIGDGINTVEKLIKDKAISFKMFGRDKEVDITDSRIQKNVEKSGYSMHDVLPQGSICRLQDVSNLSLGGTTYDVIKKISPYYRKLAVNISKYLGLRLAGIDIIADDITDLDSTNYTILEVNSAPGLDNYMYEGKQRQDYVKGLYGKVLDFLETLQ